MKDLTKKPDKGRLVLIDSDVVAKLKIIAGAKGLSMRELASGYISNSIEAGKESTLRDLAKNLDENRRA